MSSWLQSWGCIGHVSHFPCKMLIYKIYLITIFINESTKYLQRTSSNVTKIVFILQSSWFLWCLNSSKSFMVVLWSQMAHYFVSCNFYYCVQKRKTKLPTSRSIFVKTQWSSWWSSSPLQDIWKWKPPSIV